MPDNASPFRLFGRSPLLLAVLVCLLGLPAAVGFLHSNAQAIREGENRNMASRPPFKLWRENAQEYIKAWDAHLKDRVGLRRQANILRLKLRYYVFRDRSVGTVTMGSGGHVFLNSPHVKPYVFFESLCLQAGDPSPEFLRDLDAVMTAATGYFRRFGAETVFALVPGSLALYADKLPPSVPPHLRRACVAYPGRDHAIAQLGRRGAETGQYRVFYPYDFFSAHKQEKYFWPKERFHWEGRSAYLFARRLFTESGALAAVGFDDPAKLDQVKDDIRVFFGFPRPIKAWRYRYPGRPMRDETVEWISAFGRLELLHHAATQNSLSDKTALMISNSFGTAVKPHLARGFAHLYALDTNFLAPERQADVFAAVAERIRPDYVFFVYDDTNLVNLPRWLAGFVELERQRASRDDAPVPQPGESRPDTPL